MTLAQLESRLSPLRERLYQVRCTRKQPALDTKIITSWNALMIRALAFAGRILGERRYTLAASDAADFLLTHHRFEGGRVWRASRDGTAKYEGFIDDYAFLVQALLELAESPEQHGRRRQAHELSEVMVRRFADKDRGGFYFTPADARSCR